MAIKEKMHTQVDPGVATAPPAPGLGVRSVFSFYAWHGLWVKARKV